MTIKNTMPEQAGEYGSDQELVRRWYHVEGETGSHRNFTCVSVAFDKLSDAKKELEKWHLGRNARFDARIVVTDETRTVVSVKKAANFGSSKWGIQCRNIGKLSSKSKEGSGE